ncbi:unnamed protein product [Amaranthus hypochondriacus]
MDLFKGKPNAPRKVKYQPKIPVRKPVKVVIPKREKIKDEELEIEKKNLIQILQDTSLGKMKFKKKEEPIQPVAFGKIGSSYSNNYKHHQVAVTPRALTNVEHKEYEEPWNYYSYYPTTLPHRRPYSGNPEILNREEFEEASISTYDESNHNSGMELGIMEEITEPKLIPLELPKNFPMTKRNAAADGPNLPTSSKSKEKLAGLIDLKQGFSGKLQVYSSGAIKLKVGDSLYNVDSGCETPFPQDVAYIDRATKDCWMVGELKEHVVVTPDIDSGFD